MTAALFVSIGFLLAGVYLLAGLIFLLPFQLYGITRVDETTHKSGIGFRIIISPGIIVFWPIILKKWLFMVKQGNTLREKPN